MPCLEPRRTLDSIIAGHPHEFGSKGLGFTVSLALGRVRDPRSGLLPRTRSLGTSPFYEERKVTWDSLTLERRSPDAPGRAPFGLQPETFSPAGHGLGWPSPTAPRFASPPPRRGDPTRSCFG